MTSLRVELNSLAQRLSWLARTAAASPRVVDTAVRRPALRRALKAAVDFSCAAIAVVVAIAFSAGFSAYGLQETATLCLLVGLLLILSDTLAGSYRTIWRYTSLPEAFALSASSALVFVVLLALRAAGIIDLSPATLLLMTLFMLLLCVGVRGLRRWSTTGGSSTLLRAPGNAARTRRALIVGAGRHGLAIARQFAAGEMPGVELVGFIDDDPAKQRAILHGVRVLGSMDDLGRLTTRYRVDFLAIAAPEATAEQLRRIVDRCTETRVSFKILPPLRDLLDGGAEIRKLREVQLEDLLGRAPVRLSLDVVARDVAGRTILITGGGGSIGSELARQIARFASRRIVLLDRAENTLYFACLELRRTHPAVEIVPVIASITNAERLGQIFRTYQPDYVFHAAAYKHVPLCEANLIEAAWNNIIGTLRVAEAAARYGVAKFVLISTDKAVNPSSILGATKRVAERVVLEHPYLAAAATDFRAVRFGNVLGSDGSVLPLFKRQLAAGGPLTVTHPDVRRYFMTIPEAVELVLQASALPEVAGRIAMLEMGEQVRILELAEQLIRLSGLVPHRDIRIEFTGLRPGEKLHEELMAENEAAHPTAVEKIRVIAGNGHNANGHDPTALRHGITRLVTLLTQGDEESVRQGIQALLPGYVPWRSEIGGERAVWAAAAAPDGALHPPAVP